MTRSTAPVQMQKNYLEDPVKIAAIFGAFLLLTVPLSLMSCWSPGRLADALTVAYVTMLGLTHFALTWVLYLHWENRKHFLSSRWNTFRYFVVPAFIMVFFACLGFLDTREPSQQSLEPQGRLAISYALVFTCLLRSLDYHHVTRQSFGVLQMLKSKMKLPTWQRTIESCFFLCMTLLQVDTFVNGLRDGSILEAKYDFDRPIAATMTIVIVTLFSIIIVNFVVAIVRARSTRSDGSALKVSLAYFILQSASSSLVVYRSYLYPQSLAMHYVEYHILMMPRCFETKLSVLRRSDRLVAWFSRRRILFGLVLLVFACWIGCGPLLNLTGVVISKGGNRLGWFLVNVLNGIFVAHYFVEALIWKFGDPFYRASLGPLYFGGRKVDVPTAI